MKTTTLPWPNLQRRGRRTTLSHPPLSQVAQHAPAQLPRLIPPPSMSLPPSLVTAVVVVSSSSSSSSSFVVDDSEVESDDESQEEEDNSEHPLTKFGFTVFDDGQTLFIS